jgi:serine/threonine protein kinase
VKIVKRGRVRDMSRLDVEIKVRCVCCAAPRPLTREAGCQAMGMLQHPHVVSLEEVLQTDDHVFLVMELCGGGTLYDALPDDVRRASSAPG